MKNIKFVLLFVLIISILFTLTACKQNPFEEYENFSMDMDLNHRIEESFQFVKENRFGLYYNEILDALTKDIGSFSSDNGTGQQINMLYMESIRFLQKAMNAAEIGDVVARDYYIGEAMSAFTGAKAVYHDFMIQYLSE